MQLVKWQFCISGISKCNTRKAWRFLVRSASHLHHIVYRINQQKLIELQVLQML